MVTDIACKTFGQGELSGHSKMQKIYDHSTQMKTLPMLAKQGRIKYSDHRGGRTARVLWTARDSCRLTGQINSIHK